jgi:hypothetical protein
MNIFVTHIAKNGEYHIPFDKVLTFDFNANVVEVEGLKHKITSKSTGCPPSSKYTVIAYSTRPVGDKDNTREHKLYTNVEALPDVKDTRFMFD